MVKPDAFDWDDAFHPSGPPQQPEQPPVHDWRTAFAEFKAQMITLIVIIPFIFAFQLIFQNYQVTGPSMVPSYEAQDRILTTSIRIGGFQPFGFPGRSDVVVFKLPLNPKSRYVKRIIGLPGERIRINEGTVIINGEILDEPYVRNRSHETLSERVLPASSYFLLGDNRIESEDSRAWGDVPRELITAKVRFAYWRERWSLY